MEKVNVQLDDRSYLISIAAGLFDNLAAFLPLPAGSRTLVVTNETIEPLFLSAVVANLNQQGLQVDTVVLPDGERYKNLATLNIIYSALLEKNHGRDSTLIALGGGVIGDLVGFAAATYQRGIPFIQLPTTLLAQVDSSVGGKTAVNHPLGKNMIGAFHQPEAVIIDINCLKSLDNRQFSAGLAEVIKYGIILDKNFFVWLENNLEAVLSQAPEALAYCIRRCCELKADIVAADEREHGSRALLNLGHTYGHAIEAQMGYGNWLHGEAVAVGMMMSAETSLRLNLITKVDRERIKNLLLRARLPVQKPKEMSAEMYWPHMLRDKKTLSGKVRLVLPTAIGQAKVEDAVTQQLVLDAINAC